MEGENVNRGIIVAVTMVSVFVFIAIGVIFLGNDGTKQEDLYVYRDRSSWNIHDHSIFRGLTPVQIANRIGTALGGAQVVGDEFLFNLFFEKEIKYDYDNGASLYLTAEYYDSEPCDYYMSIDISEQGDGELQYDLPHAINKTVEFFTVLLDNFEYELKKDFVTEVDGANNNWVGWRVNLRQTFQGTLLETSGMRALVDYHTGKVCHVWIGEWIYMDEIEYPSYDWDHSLNEVLSSLDRINYTTMVPLESNPYPNFHSSWMEFVNEPVDAMRAQHLGYASTLGRFCVILGIEYWVQGNFSCQYIKDGDRSKTYTTWVNDTIHCIHKWYFDTETGKLIYWTLSDEYIRTEKKFFENLFGGNTTWDVYMMEYYPSLIK
ncbi:MAG: hypothetical protein ACMUHU_03800 [Thermoplasmatota archaeon]